MRDLACHLVIDAQDVLITPVTPAEGEPTPDAVTYWEVTATPPTGGDPLDALTVRLAAAYGEPWLLRFHLDDVGSAAGRAAELADPAARVSTRGEVLTAGETTWRRTSWSGNCTIPTWSRTSPDVPGPPAEGLARARETLESIAGTPFPTALSDPPRCQTPTHCCSARVVGSRTTRNGRSWASWPRGSRSSWGDRPAERRLNGPGPGRIELGREGTGSSALATVFHTTSTGGRCPGGPGPTPAAAQPRDRAASARELGPEPGCAVLTGAHAA
nr:hypothetical protein [Actinopolyspora erythraea]